MTTLRSNLDYGPHRDNDGSVKDSLSAIDRLLDEAPHRLFDEEYFALLGEELRTLHAQFRISHAADALSDDDPIGGPIPPEHQAEFDRLRAEHQTILGQLDRIIRCVNTMADLALEDKDVFFTRVRELLAILYRHEAEENRLFYMAVWRDTGGES